MRIIVIYTNVAAAQDVSVVESSLSDIADIVQWTIDIEDCDKVLRVLAWSDVTQELMNVLGQYGYSGAVRGCRAVPPYPYPERV